LYLWVVKALTRKIGYVKPTSSVKVNPVKKTETTESEPEVKNDTQNKEPEIDLVAIVEASKLKTKKVVKWINEHEEFKWGVMCTKLGIDRGNFQRTLNSDEPSIKIELVLQIENFLTAYGYAK